ncbi:MAG: hypothetical protein EA386_14025 [Rhodobacteraceae bacterium]|nr:MAG: hypothetical protein EA386_14025 [Paracoccaceae bacterium]
MPQTPNSRQSACIAVAAGALMLVPASAVALDDAPVAEATDFVFEVVDIGFCFLPEMADEEMRDFVLESAGTVPLTGDVTAPVEAGIYGSGHFIRGSGGTEAISASMHAMMINDADEITALCLVILPTDGPEGFEGQFTLLGPEEYPGEGEAYYSVFGRILGRDATGEEHSIADLSGGEGTLHLDADEGEMLTARLEFSGVMNDGQDLQFALEAEMIEMRDMRFMDMTSP